MPRFLLHYGSSLGIDGLCPAENGVCSIQIDDAVINLECSADTPSLYVYSPICPLPDSDAARLALYGFRLELDSLFKGMDGSPSKVEESFAHWRAYFGLSAATPAPLQEFQTAAQKALIAGARI